jgi:hypothetical protein
VYKGFIKSPLQELKLQCTHKLHTGAIFLSVLETVFEAICANYLAAELSLVRKGRRHTMSSLPRRFRLAKRLQRPFRDAIKLGSASIPFKLSFLSIMQVCALKKKHRLRAL